MSGGPIDVTEVLRALDYAKRQVQLLAVRTHQFASPRASKVSPRRRARMSPEPSAGRGLGRKFFVARKGRKREPWLLGVAFGAGADVGGDVVHVVWNNGMEEHVACDDAAAWACPTAGPEGCLVAVERYTTLPGRAVEMAGLLVKASSRWSVMEPGGKVPAARASQVKQGDKKVSAFSVLEVPRSVSHEGLEPETAPAICARVLQFAGAASAAEARAVARDPVLGSRVVRWFACNYVVKGGAEVKVSLPWVGRVVGVDPGDVGRRGAAVAPLYRVEYEDDELCEESRAQVMDGALEAECVLRARAVLGRSWARRATLLGRREASSPPEGGVAEQGPGGAAAQVGRSAEEQQARPGTGKEVVDSIPASVPPGPAEEEKGWKTQAACASVQALEAYFEGLAEPPKVGGEDGDLGVVTLCARLVGRPTHLYKAQTSGRYRACRMLAPARGGVGATIMFLKGCNATRDNVDASLLEKFDSSKQDRSWAACATESDPERAALRRSILDQQEARNKSGVRRARGIASGGEGRGMKARAKRRGGLAGIEKAFSERIGKGKPRSRKGRMKRYTIITEEDTTSLVALAHGYAWLRGSSQDTYESICEGYFQAMETCSPPLLPLPVEWWKLALWVMRRYLRGCLSNPSNIKPLFSAVYDWGVRNGCHVDAPMPGLPMAGRKKLARFTKALAELEDEGITRAFPCVLALFEYVWPFVDLTKPRELQKWYCLLLAHCGMLRKDDFAEGKLAGSYITTHGTPGYDIPERECVVPPGKATAGFETVAIPGWKKLSMGGPVTPARLGKFPMLEQLSVAVVGEAYLAYLRAEYGKPLDGDIDLFPLLDEDGHVQSGKAMSTRELLEWFRGLARQAGLPEELVLALQLHGLRSGGATDAFVRAGGSPEIIAYIKKQGRWTSDCWSIYVRLRRGLVSSVFEGILAGGGLTSKERELVQQAHVQAQQVTEAMFSSVADLVEGEFDVAAEAEEQ